MGPALAGLLAALCGAVTPGWAADPPRPRAPASVPHPLADLAERARAGVVHVRGLLQERNPRSQSRGPGSAGVSVGSGFVVDRRGSVVTNEHVVRGATDLRVRLHDGREFSACVLGTDELADVAVLKVEARDLPTVLALGDSDKVRVGEEVVAIGSPFGFSHSVTAGIVSATERVIEPGSEQAASDEEPPYSFLHTDRRLHQPGQLGRAAARRRRAGHRHQRRVLGRAPAGGRGGLRHPDQRGQAAAAAAARLRRGAALVPGGGEPAGDAPAGSGLRAAQPAGRAGGGGGEGLAGRGGRAGVG